MKINTNFNNNIIPYDAAGAQPVDLINNNPIKSFPFNVVDLPPGTQYIAWTLIDYDAVPVCGFPWIHWVVANVSVNSDTIDIVEDFLELKVTLYKVRTALQQVYWMKIFQRLKIIM